MKLRPIHLPLFAITGILFSAMVAQAWTGPSATAPNNNVAAPVNVGAITQVKAGLFGVNSLLVFGNTLLAANSYINWGLTAGSGGYGIRDNAGTLEFKQSSAGSWQTMQAFVAGLVGTSPWVTNGTHIYNSNTGNVGIGNVSPAVQLDLAASDNTVSTIRQTFYGTGNTRQQQRKANGTSAAPTIVALNDRLGTMVFQGYDGAAFVNGAQILVDVDGTPGLNDMPTRLAFLTTPDGSATLAERMRITAAGNVGIGTTAPGRKLDVVANVTGDYAAGFYNVGTHGAVGTGSQYGLVGYANTAGYIGVLGQNTVSNAQGLLGNGTTGAQGNSTVGHGVVGNGSPTGSTYYGVIGSAGAYYGGLGRADGYSFVGNGTLYNNGTASIGNILVLNGATGDSLVEVGTGATANRNAYIDFIGDATYTDYGLRLIRYNTGANAWSELLNRGTGGLALTSQDAAPIVFKTSNAEVARISPTGSVGIGTASPDGALDVMQTISGLTTGLRFTAHHTPGVVAGGIINAYDDGGTTRGLTLQGHGGNVGIGTLNPATRLDVTGQVNANSTSGAGGYISTGNYGGTGSAAYFPQGLWSHGASAWIYGSIYINGPIVDTTNRMTLNPAGSSFLNGGNVGIGTSVPGAKLHVVGNVNADGFFHNSDARVKKNITTIDGLSLIEKLHGVTFDWKESGKKGAGVIAQEVEEVLPSAVHTDESGKKSVEYDQLIAPLIEAVKELKRENDNQQEEIVSLRKQIRDLHNR
jgi:Chaperone of endosialidase